MSLSVTILGSGAATPTLGRHCSAQAINISGCRMLVDCGESTQNQLRAYRQKMQSFSHIFISHLHGDHLFGLPGLLASMHLCGRTEPVIVYAPKGLRAAMELLFEVSGTHLEYPLEFCELEGEGSRCIFESDRCRVTAFPLRHTVPTYGFLFEEPPQLPHLRHEVRERYQLTPIECMDIKRGADYVAPDGTIVPHAELTYPPRRPYRYAYCCDTAYDESLIPFIEGVDLLCMESTFDQSRESLAAEKCHCTAAQAARIAQQAHVGKLILTHFSARYKEVEPLIAEAAAIFPNTVAAEDGARYEMR